MQQANENSRMYNEMVIIKMVQSMSKLLQHPPDVFREEIIKHFKQTGLKMYERIRYWMEYVGKPIAAQSKFSSSGIFFWLGVRG